MGLEIEVHEQSCRGCELCVDICPTEVFEMDAEKKVCTVKQVDDCIACLSCAYICPSQAITHRGHHLVKNFYRDEEFCRKMERFL
ncbi:4Fe-4S dicluster domain-containing protein [Geomonas sp.]|uniref:4Fe-4S dicluster domain-containing protein n=1 Tax=Geomonas sp. TaxID=2651584 RepID=UPI002B49F6F5|nr:4Fe-4S binding protein [Geomonas sp.]HJV36385.1 4Fe-4S binding protein [Geomonas sp.]